MTKNRFAIEQLEPWLEARFTRSGGPGGQNVKKLNTRARLLFDFEACDLLSDNQKRRIRARLATRLSRDGRLGVVASRSRTQAANRAAAESRLIELIEESLKTRRVRVATRPTRASRERRIQDKRHKGDQKRSRRAPSGSE